MTTVLTRGERYVKTVFMANTKKVCRQVTWQNRRRAEGRCVICGEATDFKSDGSRYVLCPIHREKRKEHYRAVVGAARAYWLAKGQGKL